MKLRNLLFIYFYYIFFIVTLIKPLYINAAEIIGNAKAAKTKVAMCIGCHGLSGYKASFPLVYDVPLIGGQNAAYLAKALKAYQQGERKNPTMQSIVESLTEQDIADISVYYSKQTPSTKDNNLR